MTKDIALEEESLKELIRILQEARKYGFSSPSSAIELYFEVAIDLNLRIQSLLREGVLGVKNNKQIRFLDFAQDALGNPLQISWRKASKFYWDPIAVGILNNYSSFLLDLKNQKPISSYLEKKQIQVKSKIPTKVGISKRKQKQLYQSKIKTGNYYRRQRQKKT